MPYLFLLSILFLILTTLLLTSLLRLRSAGDFFITAPLLAFANLVFIFQAANLLQGLDSPATILWLQAGLLALSLAAWLILGKPAVLPEKLPLNKLFSWLKDRDNRPLLVLAVAVTAMLLLSAVLVYVVPPNNNDALSYHVARIVQWMQRGSYFPWETPFTWQLSFPVNAQLTYLWTVLFTRTDHFIAFIPYFAGILCAFLVYRFALELGFNRRNAAFAGLIWLTFPVVQLHLTSVRHDLISTWLFLTLIYCFYCWAKRHRFSDLLLSAMAFGLVIGTNFSIATYLPGFLLMAFLSLFLYRLKLRQLLQWAAAGLLAFFLLSSPIYISNQQHFGSPVGPDAYEMTSPAMIAEMPRGKYIAVTSMRWFYQLYDLSWLPDQIEQPLLNGKAALARTVSTPLGLNLEGDVATMDAHEFSWAQAYHLQEDEAWFGLIGALLIFPTSLVAFVQGIKQKSLLKMMPFLFFITGLVTCSLIRPGWTPFDGRYFMPVAALSSALLPLWLNKKLLKTLIEWLIVIVSIFSMSMVVLFNPAKQVVGGAAVWQMNRLDLLTRQSYSSKDLLYLAEAIPSGAVLGVSANPQDYQEYGLFGSDFSRRVVNIFPREIVSDPVWLRDRNVEYVLVHSDAGESPHVASGYHQLDSLRDWILYKYSP